ncbi:hypothetical protein [Microbacterium sp. XT11]|uniref:hypothetical protein n=1 Tax=Microbacterium sp. XT11 TaxID=367477 RepID=UPI00082D5A85|nr:hypothetical protein [Microbacterium sp. XT11]
MTGAPQRRPRRVDAAAAPPVVIGDAHTTVSFDPVTGAVQGLRDARGVEWIRPDVEGSLFVIEIPRGGDRTVVIETDRQQLDTAAVERGGASAVLRWTDPVTSTGERLTGWIEVRATVERSALRLGLSLHLDDGGVEAVRFPSLRGIRPEDSERLDLRGVDYSTGTRIPLLPAFDSNAPYWGTTFPDYASGNLRPELVGNPTSPFIVLAADSGGLTVLPSAPTLDFIGWRASLEPGFADSMARTAGDEGAVTLDAIHFPPGAGADVTLPDMTIAPYSGEWTDGMAAYRRTQGPTRRSRASWLDEPRSWLQVQLMSTEGEPRYDFADLIDIIEECADAGIGAIQIVGWNDGGQDGLVPVHRVSEKLGGAPALRRALERAAELDVKTVLYVKYVWVEKPGPHWDEFSGAVALDANGQPYAQPGPVYHSARKRYGISTPWYVPVCFGVRWIRERFAAEIAGMADLGADGVLADESLYHGRSLLCFAADHGHAIGESTFRWDGEFIDDVRRRLGDRAEGFVIAAEGAFDAQFEHYDVSYFRSASPSHRPVGRMLRPGAPIVTALTGFDDRSMVNQALLFGYGLSFEPFNFKGRPRDMPDTVSYGVRMDALRAKFADRLWRGELVDVRSGAADGLPDGIHVTRWRATDGAACVVVANQGDGDAEVRVDDIPPGAVISRPDDEVIEEFAGTVRLGARCAAIIG